MKHINLILTSLGMLIWLGIICFTYPDVSKDEKSSIQGMIFAALMAVFFVILRLPYVLKDVLQKR